MEHLDFIEQINRYTQQLTNVTEINKTAEIYYFIVLPKKNQKFANSTARDWRQTPNKIQTNKCFFTDFGSYSGNLKSL